MTNLGLQTPYLGLTPMLERPNRLSTYPIGPSAYE